MTPTTDSTGTARTTDTTGGSAFLAEVRAQWATAREQLDRASATLDEWGLLEAKGRMRDLEDILRRNDAPLTSLALA